MSYFKLLHRSFSVLFLILGFLFSCYLSGCGLNMEKNYQKLRPDLLKHDYSAASVYLDRVKESFYSRDNRLLYYMDKGTVLYLGGKYQEANKVLETAETTAEDLWTESIGANAAAWLTTDNSLPYQGEEFEKVLINVFKAFNYLGLRDYNGARVEAKRVTEKLELYNSKHAEEKASEVYQDDAFARWLSGKLAETDLGFAALNDAWIDYRKALEVYEQAYTKRYQTPVARIVLHDALRVLEGLGLEFQEELLALKKRYAAKQLAEDYVSYAESLKLGELIFFHLNGEAPYKVDKYWTVIIDGELLRIAYPEFVAKPHRITNVRLELTPLSNDPGGTPAKFIPLQPQSELLENITAIATHNLADHMGRIKTKAIARQVSKFMAGKALEGGGRSRGHRGSNKNEGPGLLQVAGALWNATNAILEEADKRSWITLPAEIGVSRVFVTPGKYQVRARFVNQAGVTLEEQTYTISLKAREKQFLSYRTYN